MDITDSQQNFLNHDDLVANYNFVNSRPDSLRGVVNIDEFAAWFATLFDPVPGNKTLKKILQDFDPLNIEGCGDDLETLRFTPTTADHEELELGDFFSKISLGVRISYISPPEDFEEVPTPETNQSGRGLATNPVGAAISEALGGVSDRFAPIRSRNAGTWENVVNKEKAYFVEETKGSGTEQDPLMRRKINTVPIVSVEVPIDMTTKINERPGGALYTDLTYKKRPKRDSSGKPTEENGEISYKSKLF